MNPLIKDVYDNIMEGNASEVKGKVETALASGVHPAVILNEGMIDAMEEVGRLFEEGEYYVPEMLIAARAMQAGLGVLKPHLLASDVKSAGKIAIGTVKGDLHDIGKNLVAMMLEGAGFEIIDLGVDVSPEKFVEVVKSDDGVQVVAMSALLTTTMPAMKTTLDALAAAGLRERVKVIIGGAPITAEYASSIGADGFSPDASRAVSLAKSLVAAQAQP
jgi:5-methyltetrahydrofolate--homocysteine methyltransferase